MGLTKKLFDIVVLLLILIAGTLCVIYREPISDNIIHFLKNATRPEIVIPETNYNKRTYDFELLKETNNFEPTSMDDLKSIYYTVLNNGWTNFTFYCTDKYPTCTDDVLTIANNSEYIEMLNYYVSPFNNYSLYNTTIVNDDEIFLEVKKLYTEDEIKVVNKYVDETIDSLNINPNNVTENDLRRVHDTIIRKISYDKEYTENSTNSDSNKAYGAVVNNKAICNGYTDLYAIFLDRFGIKNIKLPSEKHIWNYVYFNNKWSHIDLTWDDDEINLDNDHNYYMINTKQLLKLDKAEHNFDKNKFIETRNES